MQLATWEVDVNGRSHAVSVDRAENGKDIVRVDGRIVAKPIDRDESGRTIEIDRWPYLLMRVDSNMYDLRPDDRAPSPAPDHQGNPLPGGSMAAYATLVQAERGAPLSLQSTLLFSRLPLFLWGAVIAATALMLWLAIPGYDKIARARVERVLSEMHSEKDSQFAISYWYVNRKSLPASELSIASDAFDKWRRHKKLYRKIGDYNIIESKELKNQKTPLAIVRFAIEGAEYSVRVPRDLPIEWDE